jgi:hypothetical protein
VSGFPVEGREEVAAGFGSLQRSLGDMTEIHRVALGPLIPDVRRRTPVRTGRLASSWSLEVSADAGSIESGLVYAGPLEYGSRARGIEPVRMVHGAIASNERAINEAYGKAITDRAQTIGFDTR